MQCLLIADQKVSVGRVFKYRLHRGKACSHVIKGDAQSEGAARLCAREYRLFAEAVSSFLVTSAVPWYTV